MAMASGPDAGSPAPHGSDATSPIPHFWAAGVCVVTFLAYVSTLRFQFVLDDRGRIVENPAVHTWRAVPSYFTSHLPAVVPAYAGNDYRPLFLLWLRINDAIFGTHAAGWHFTTVLAHLFVTYGVIMLAHRLLNDWPAALFSGLLFGLHPVHFEAVAYVSAVSEQLAAALLIPAYLCWVRARDESKVSGQWLGTSLALYTLALFTKETALVLPLLLAASLALGFPRELPGGGLRKIWQAFQALVPYLLLTAAYAVARTLALHGLAPAKDQARWATVILTWPSLLLFYLKLLVWPLNLNPFYNLFYASPSTVGNTVLPGAVLLLVALGLWRWASRSRPAALAIPWLVLAVLPVLNLGGFGDGNFAHNRYIYLPSAGFVMLVALALRQLDLGSRVARGIPVGQGLLCLGLALFLGLAINLQDGYYRNEATYYAYADATTGGRYPEFTMNLANALAEQGDFDRASVVYEHLIETHPGMMGAYYNLGIMCYHHDQLPEAEQCLSRVVTADPSQPDPIFYLGMTEMKLHHLNQAETCLRRAVALAPTARNYHFALGIVLRISGNQAEALREFNQELALNPQHLAAAQQVRELRGTSPAKSP